MWKFSKKKDTLGKTGTDNVMDFSNIENPDVKGAPSPVKGNYIWKKNRSTKTIVIIMIAVIVVLVISLAIFVYLYLSNQNGNDNLDSSVVSNSESIASTSSVDFSLNEDDYMGYWHIQYNADIELFINDISNGIVNFTYWSYPLGPMKIEAELDGTIASFSYNQDGMSVNGFLTFNPTSVVIDITESNNEYIPITTYSFNERSQRSWFLSNNYDTSITDMPESDYQSEAYSYSPYEESPYYEEYPYGTESEEEYVEPPQAIPESKPEQEQETSSQTSSVSSNAGSARKPEPAGVKLDSYIYGLGELQTKTVNGIVFKWYDRYERWEPFKESNPSIDIISMDLLYELHNGHKRYTIKFEVEVSKDYRASLWWKAYDGEGYFIEEYLTSTQRPILEKFKDINYQYTLPSAQKVKGIKEMILIPSLS